MQQGTTAENLLSIADIARHFNLPESTTRYYCKRFSTFIPSVGEGRRRRFRPETLEVITAILEEMKLSRTAQAVEDALEERFPRNAIAPVLSNGKQPVTVAVTDSAIIPQALLTFFERQTRALESIAGAFPLLLERLPATPAPATTAGDTETVQSLRQEVETLKLLLASSEKTQQADLEQLRTWMSRVIQRREGVS